MFRKLSILAVLLFAVSALWAQPVHELGSISGIVTLADGTPAVGAHVNVPWGIRPNIPAFAVTDEAGAYSIDSLYAGRHWVGAHMLNLEAWELVDVPANENLVVNFQFEGTVVETGAIAGTVMFSDGVVAAGAIVNLDGGDRNPGHGGQHGIHLSTVADELGAFGFDPVPVGNFELNACVRMQGFANAEVVVTADQTTNVTLTIQARDTTGHGGGHDTTGHGEHHGDSLTTIELSGIAIVLAPDSLHHRTRYFIDTNADSIPDYRLAFGPEWYEPASGAVRPVNGDQITVQGGLFTYTEPPVVIVYQLNGLVWREPRQGHGGHPGGDHQHGGCNPDSVVRVELEGTAIVINRGGMHGDITLYAITTDEDTLPNYILDFGRADYQPSNGATRPAAGDAITIVGGQITCLNPMGVPIVLVYEINGLLWREPGDTIGLGPELAVSVNEPVYLGVPSTYLTAKNFPNPFNPTTTIAYSIPMAGDVNVTIYDITGREVSNLVNSYQNAGSYSVQMDGTNLSSGIYFYSIRVGSMKYTNRMVLLK